MLVVPLLPVLARVFIDTVSSVAGMVIVVTGLSAGAFRAAAVLTGSPPQRVEWMTAAGFAGGVALSALVFLLELVLR